MRSIHTFLIHASLTKEHKKLITISRNLWVVLNLLCNFNCIEECANIVVSRRVHHFRAFDCAFLQVVKLTEKFLHLFRQLKFKLKLFFIKSVVQSVCDT